MKPSGHLSSLPHWDSRDWICGAPREVARGWTLRQEWWEPPAPPGPPWAPPSPLPQRPTRGGLPLTSGCGPGWGGCAALRWGGLTLYPPPPLPRAGHLLPEAAVGTSVPLLESVPSPTPRGGGGAGGGRAGALSVLGGPVWTPAPARPVPSAPSLALTWAWRPVAATPAHHSSLGLCLFFPTLSRSLRDAAQVARAARGGRAGQGACREHARPRGCPGRGPRPAAWPVAGAWLVAAPLNLFLCCFCS